jgi:hypothetical protein
MSSAATPICPEQFALALEALPQSSLYAKAAEIRNSLAHLAHSNAQLQPLADQGDSDCLEALVENRLVMDRMRTRLVLLKHEVERRGGAWHGDYDAAAAAGGGGGGVQEGVQDGAVSTPPSPPPPPPPAAAAAGPGARARQPEPQRRNVGDEEMARRLGALMDEGEGEDEGDGVHL